MKPGTPGEYHSDRELSAQIAVLRVRSRSEPGPALAAADELARLAARRQDRRLAAWAELVRAVCLNNSIRSGEGLAAGRKALLHFTALGERRGRTFAMRAIGVSYRWAGDARKALEWYRRALAAAEAPGCGEERALLHNNLGAALEHLGESAIAVGWYERGLAVARESGDRRTESVLRMNLGNLQARLDEPRLAMAHYRAALRLATSLEDPFHAGECLSCIGALQGALGRHREAVRTLTRALAVSRGCGSRTTELNAQVNMALARRMLGARAEAAEQLHRTARAAKIAPHPYMEAVARSGLGELRIDAGDYAGAVRHIRAALAIAERIQERRLMQEFHAQCAKALTLAGDRKTAVVHAATGRRLARELRDPARRRLVWMKKFRAPPAQAAKPRR